MRLLMQDAYSTEREVATPAPGAKRGFHRDKQIEKKSCLMLMTIRSSTPKRFKNCKKLLRLGKFFNSH